MSGVTKAAKDAARVVEDHHDAFLVELLGESAVTPTRLEQLIKKKVLKRSQIGRLAIGKVSPDTDPFQMAITMSQVFDEAQPNEIVAMRRWPLSRWADFIKAKLRRDPAPPTAPPKPPGGGGGRPSPPSTGGLPIPAPPDHLGIAETDAYVQAYTRAGEYVRGLGNKVAGIVENSVMEVWAGEELAVPVNAATRADAMAAIRTETADAVARAKTARKLASELGNKTEDWGRDWLRIAKTELQGAYNDGQILRAHRVYGDEAQIARVPESDACAHCVRLFIEGGKPIIFKLEDLLANGTNVGRKSRDWQPTAWPVHPNCRCDTQVVPPGYGFDDDWFLTKSPGG